MKRARRWWHRNSPEVWIVMGCLGAIAIVLLLLWGIGHIVVTVALWLKAFLSANGVKFP